MEAGCWIEGAPTECQSILVVTGFRASFDAARHQSTQLATSDEILGQQGAQTGATAASPCVAILMAERKHPGLSHRKSLGNENARQPDLAVSRHQSSTTTNHHGILCCRRRSLLTIVVLAKQEVL